MLASGGIPPLTDQARTPDSDNPRGYYEYEKVKLLARDNSWLDEAKGHAIKIVAPLLPNLLSGAYRIIFMDRDIDELLRSQSTMLERSGKAGGRSTTEQKTSVFQSQLRRAEDFVQSAGYLVLHVAHRECVEDPSGVASGVNDFLGSDLDEAAVVDETLYRLRG